MSYLVVGLVAVSVEHLGNEKVCYSALPWHILVAEQDALKDIWSEVTESGLEELKETENIAVPSYYTVQSLMY